MENIEKGTKALFGNRLGVCINEACFTSCTKCKNCNSCCGHYNIGNGMKACFRADDSKLEHGTIIRDDNVYLKYSTLYQSCEKCYYFDKHKETFQCQCKLIKGHISDTPLCKHNGVFIKLSKDNINIELGEGDHVCYTKYPKTINECYADSNYKPSILTEKNIDGECVCNSKWKVLAELVEAVKLYNNGWVPDWCDSKECRYAIVNSKDNVVPVDYSKYDVSTKLVFRDEDACMSFLYNFKTQIEFVKDLL